MLCLRKHLFALVSSSFFGWEHLLSPHTEILHAALFLHDWGLGVWLDVVVEPNPKNNAESMLHQINMTFILHCH